MKNISAFIHHDPFFILKLPARQKDKMLVIEKAADYLYTKQRLTEKEITKRLSMIYEDPVELRRYLIDFGFMQRTNDGSAYWFTSPAPAMITIRLF